MLIRTIFRAPGATFVLAALIAAAALSLGWASSASAHEIPRQVAVNAFVKPEATRLRVLVRVPLEAMRDMEFKLRGPGFLDIARSDSLLRDAAKLWVADGIAMYENGSRLKDASVIATRASLPSDGAFATYAGALAQTAGAPLPADVDIPWQQAMLDVLLEYEITSASSKFSMEPSLAGLGVRTTSIVRFLPVNGTERAFMYEGDPGIVALDPGFLDAAWRFLRLGFSHILDGIDHLLFVLCLVLPFRKIRPLIGVVTSFTVAHSITLFGSAFGFAPDALWFPPLVEATIALSILYMACENMLGANLERRWVVAFGFGLVHGFGFSFALRESLQFAGSHLVTSLAAFNVGVELGQVAVVAVAVPMLAFLFARVPERAGIILLSAFVAHTAWHWTTERGATLTQYRFELPAFDAMLLANSMRVAMMLIVIGAAGWLLRGALGRFAARPSSTSLLLAAIIGAGTLATQPQRASAQSRPTTGTTKAPPSATKAPAGTASKTAPQSVQKPPAKPAQKLSGRSTMTGVYTTEQATQGKETFTGNCSGCHTPATHTGPAFTLKWAGRTADDLFSYIRNQMPKSNPGSLTEDEYVWVTAYLFKLNGMPAGTTELSGDPALLKGLRIEVPKKKRT